MKQYFLYVKNHVFDTFNPWFLFVTAVSLSTAIYFNYQLDFEDQYIDKGNYRSELRMFYYFLFEGGVFLFACFVLGVTKGNWTWLKSRGFWITFVFGFAVLGFDRGFYYHNYLRSFIDGGGGYFIVRIVKQFSWLITTLLPLILFYKFFDYKYQTDFYGIRKNGFSLKPYIVMYAIMIPLIVIASYTDQFMETYPLYKNTKGMSFSSFYNVSEFVPKVIFEFVYGLDFFSVELFFRGFLIFAFSRFLGKDVVYPMVYAYCFLHFGKPMGETISSIFGGYILGVIALNSRNIWGGVLIHAGIAVLMDIAALWQLQK